MFEEAVQNDRSLTISKFLSNIDTLVYTLVERATEMNNITFEKVKTIMQKRLSYSEETEDKLNRIDKNAALDTSQPTPAPQVALFPQLLSTANINLSEAEQIELALVLPWY